jgi:hypothetical protein
MSKVDGQILDKEKTKNWKLKINSGKNHIIIEMDNHNSEPMIK